MPYKLGKNPPKFNKFTLSLKKYLPRLTPSPDFGVSLPAPPARNFWEYAVPESQWQMFANDTLGCCTVAAIAHMVMAATKHTGEMFIPLLQDVIDFYSAVSGYVPGDESTDNGAAITDVLARWQTLGISGHKILGWAAIDQTNLTEVMQGNYIFGGVDGGFQVPQYAMEQVDAKMPWTIMQGDSNIVGGHSVPIFGYGSKGATCVTWGALQQMSWDFFKTYFDEAYIVVTEDWLKQADGLTPSGFNLDALKADLAAMQVTPPAA